MVSKWPAAGAQSPGPGHRWYGGYDVRRPKVVAIAALIAAFATVAVPGPVGSRAPSSISTPSADLFASVEIAAVRGPTMTTPPLDPSAQSDGNLDESSTLFEPDLSAEPPQARVKAAQPEAKAGAVNKNNWRLDSNVSWYGPGFYGKRTACGHAMTEGLVGVAHRTLPCGTKITFKNPARAVRERPPVGPHRWAVPEAGSLLHRLALLEVRLPGLMKRPSFVSGQR
jgi:hypothetical protein